MSTNRGEGHIQVQIDEQLYLKDPHSSEIGHRILEQGIQLMDDIGFESFTFRKLAQRLGVTEPTIYRYFKSKHRLLLYLTSWYWTWMDHRIAIATTLVASPTERLRYALRELTQPITADDATPHIDEGALYRVVVAESSKVYLNRTVDDENREGHFRIYKRLCKRVAGIISELSPTYAFPVALVSTVLESSHMHKYFAEHLPSLTEVSSEQLDVSTTAFLTDMVFRVIGVTG